MGFFTSITQSVIQQLGYVALILLKENPEMLLKSLDFILNRTKVPQYLEDDVKEKEIAPVVAEDESITIRANPIPQGDSEGETRELKFGDGRGGLLYKLGERTNRPVVLLPGWYGKAKRVGLKGRRNTINFFFTGFDNPESNGTLRAHYRTDKTVEQVQNLVGTTPKLFIDEHVIRLNKGANSRHD